MHFSFTFKSSVLLIFFFHGVVFSALLWLKSFRTENKPSLWLSAFTFLCSLYIAPFMLGYAGWYSQQPYRDFLFYMPFQQLFLLPPILYFYLRSLFDQSFRFSKKDYLHFLPAALYFAYSLIVLVTDKMVLNEYYFYADERDKDFVAWYQLAGFMALTVYLVKSLNLYSKYKKLTYQTVSFADLVMFRWAKQFLLAFLLLVAFRLAFFIVNPEWAQFGKKFWYYLSFSFLFYFVSINGYTNSVSSVTSLNGNPTVEEDGEEQAIPQITVGETIVTTGAKKGEPQDLELWKEKIHHLMVVEKMYENPNLVISDLSGKLATHPKKISQAINQGFGLNFNDYVNQHRVKALLQKLNEGEHNEKTLLGLALECGFNSKSTFNRAFRKESALSPKEYIEKNYKK